MRVPSRPRWSDRLIVRNLLFALALIAGAVAPAIGASSAAAAPQDDRSSSGIGIRLVDVPAASVDDPRARTYVVDHLKPGAVIERRIEVENNAASDAQVKVYSSAASIAEGGFVGASGNDQNEMSSWTSATPSALELGPNEKSLVEVTVKVPADAVEGERYGVIWAETTIPPTASGGVTRVGRVGIRLYLSVGPGGAPPTQ